MKSKVLPSLGKELMDAEATFKENKILKEKLDALQQQVTGVKYNYLQFPVHFVDETKY